MNHLLDQYSVLLLDMNGTFMFGQDRFGPGENFHATYLSLGGAKLEPAQVNSGIRSCSEGMLQLYQSPLNYDDFPSLTEGLGRFADFSQGELPLLEQVFTMHECGFIPPAYAALRRRLSQTHQLGLVTNIWARKAVWLSEFQRAGISDVFSCQVFSSESRSIKPSLKLFRRALQSFPSDSRVLFVGDSLICDIEPANALGLATAWINPRGDISAHADHLLPSLLEIEADSAKTVPEFAPAGI